MLAFGCVPGPPDLTVLRPGEWPLVLLEEPATVRAAGVDSVEELDPLADRDFEFADLVLVRNRAYLDAVVLPEGAAEQDG